MTLFEKVVQWDHWLFQQINAVWTNDLFDFFFPYITDIVKRPLFAYFVFPALLIYTLYRARWHTVRVIVGALLVFAVSDNLNHRVLKPAFQRKRPPAVLENVQLRTHSHSGLSFPSNHSSNSFALMMFLSFFLVKYRWWLFLYAAAVAYSRVYVGVHFPADVTVAAITGSVIGYTGAKVYLQAEKKFLKAPA